MEKMALTRRGMPGEQVLLDSDAFVGWLVAHDAHHARMLQVLDVMRHKRIQPLTTNLVVAETATMLSYRMSHTHAVQFLKLAASVRTVLINQELHERTLEIFAHQTRNKTSFVDLANVAVMQTLHIPWIVSFDKTYADDFGLTTFPSTLEM